MSCRAYEMMALEREVVCAKFAYTTRHGAIAGKTQVKEVGLDMKRFEKPILVTRPNLPPIGFLLWGFHSVPSCP